MATLQGSFTVDGLPRDNATVNLYAITAPFTVLPPVEGTPFPSGGLVATVLTGPANGAEGAWRFAGVADGEYYVGVSWNGLYAWDYRNVNAATTSFTSGALVVAVPSTFTGNVFDVNNTSDLFNLAVDTRFYNSPTVPAVTGHLAGPLVITQPDNNVFLRFVDTAPISGAHIIDAGPYHTLRFSGNAGDPPARHQFSLMDKMMPSNTYGLDGTTGWNTFTVDADGQCHIQPKVFHGLSSSNNHMLRLAAWCDGQPGVGFGSGMEYYAQRLDGAGVQIAMTQAYWTKLTSGGVGDDSVLELWTLQSGVNTRFFQANANGSLDIGTGTGGTGRITIPSTPDAISQYGAMSIGDGGWANGTHNFVGTNAGTYLAISASGGTQADLINAQVAGTPYFWVGADGLARHRQVDTSPSGVAFPLHLFHSVSTGTVGTGMGTGIQLFGLDRSQGLANIGQIYAFATDTTPNAVTSNIIVQCSSGGAIQTALQITPDGKLLAQGALGVGNAISKTTLTSPGTVVKMVEILDASGNSLGAIAVYNKGSFS